MLQDIRLICLMLLMFVSGQRLANGEGTPGEFDFYVLALSWSPTYCDDNGANDPQQCGIGKRFGFVLHGLWPQYEKGYPSECSSTQMPDKVTAEFPGLYPNDKLYRHEWEKHGTCSGLTPKQYLALSKTLKESVNIPKAYRKPEKPLRVTTDEIAAAFQSSNPTFEHASFAVYCADSGRFLREILVCFDQDGRPISCSNDIRRKAAKSCQQPTLLIKNVR
ncbi:ribonuclease, T2 family [Candidatus Moduliflexus flocculans]|uniref:Ribonuclease, T2 family n=1 Tax=Candidatus Moduliflexus flocculans TaxID=1499966 RepID=A0A0S6VU91_9BACT|nr:ribonuclease, T2 family [Candidatus Moduliflexus flocculans]